MCSIKRLTLSICVLFPAACVMTSTQAAQELECGLIEGSIVHQDDWLQIVGKAFDESEEVPTSGLSAVGGEGGRKWRTALWRDSDRTGGTWLPAEFSLVLHKDMLLVAYKDHVAEVLAVRALDPASGEELWPLAAVLGSHTPPPGPATVRLTSFADDELIGVTCTDDQRCQVLGLRVRGPGDIKQTPIDEFQCALYPAIGSGLDRLYVACGDRMLSYVRSPEGEFEKTESRFGVGEAKGPRWVGKKIRVLSDGRLAGVVSGSGHVSLVVLDPMLLEDGASGLPVITLLRHPGDEKLHDIRGIEGGVEFVFPDAKDKAVKLVQVAGGRVTGWGEVAAEIDRAPRDTAMCFTPEGDLLQLRTKGWTVTAAHRPRPEIVPVPAPAQHDEDADEVSDATDSCPLQAETPNGLFDDDGCPDGMVGPSRGGTDRTSLGPISSISILAPTAGSPWARRSTTSPTVAPRTCAPQWLSHRAGTPGGAPRRARPVRPWCPPFDPS